MNFQCSFCISVSCWLFGATVILGQTGDGEHSNSAARGINSVIQKANLDGATQREESIRSSLEKLKLSGRRLSRGERKKWVSEVLDGTSARKLTRHELRLVASQLLASGPDASLVAYWEKLAVGEGPDAVVACAVLAAKDVNDPTKNRNRILATLGHPAYGSVLKERRFSHLLIGDDPLIRVLLFASILNDEELRDLEPTFRILLKDLTSSTTPAAQGVTFQLAGRLNILKERLSEDFTREASGLIRNYVNKIGRLDKPAIRLRSLTKLADNLSKPHLIGRMAPELDITWDSNGLGIQSLEDLRGSVVLLDFWGRSCGPCIATFPGLAKLQAKYADEKFVATVSPLPRTGVANHPAGRRSTLCCTFPGLAPGGSYPPSCPVESGLSSAPAKDAATVRAAPWA